MALDPVKTAVRQAAVGAALLAHLAALALSGLPDSPARTLLLTPFARYVTATGQEQSWLMFRTTVHWRAAVELIAEWPDGSRTHPWGTQDTMAPRRKYLIHSLAVRDRRTDAEGLLDAIAAELPTRPRSLTLDFTREELPTLAETMVGGAGRTLKTERREYRRSW